MKPKERQDKGLCFKCDEKFRLGHCCKKLFLIEGSWVEEGSGEKVEVPLSTTIVEDVQTKSLKIFFTYSK